MEVGYDKAALQEYMDQVGTVGEQMRCRQDESLNVFNSCKQQYNRIYTKLEEVAHRAYNQLENAESMQRSAELEYETARRTAENAEDEDEKMQLCRGCGKHKLCELLQMKNIQKPLLLTQKPLAI